jgi:hypothetical protein
MLRRWSLTAVAAVIVCGAWSSATLGDGVVEWLNHPAYFLDRLCTSGMANFTYKRNLPHEIGRMSIITAHKIFVVGSPVDVGVLDAVKNIRKVIEGNSDIYGPYGSVWRNVKGSWFRDFANSYFFSYRFREDDASRPERDIYSRSASTISPDNITYYEFPSGNSIKQ